VEVSDRQFAQGTPFGPDAPMDFGITQLSIVRTAYQGRNADVPEGPMLRLIARIEQPTYLMIAATKESGISDLRQIRERKIPVRILGGNAAIQEFYGITAKDVEALGGRILAGNALAKNPNFDVMIGTGVLANNPEGSMWYEMTMTKDLVFLPVPEEVRQRLVKDDPLATLVDLPFRYMRGVPDTPVASVGTTGVAVYGREDTPEAFVYAVAKAIDEHRGLLKWALMPFSYDASTVGDGAGVPLHPGAARYYRERGYVK
jgi:TRAP transporter TAXI family solute receptor